MAVDRTAVATRTRRGRTWSVIAVAGAVVLAAVGWLVIGLTPSLSAGSFDGSLADPEAHRVAKDAVGGTGEQSVVTDPTDGTNDAIWSFANAGRVPVVVRVGDPQPAAPVLTGVRVFVLDPTDPLRNLGAASDAVRLEPGQEVGVAISVGFGCETWDAGTGVLVDRVTLRVTTLGVTRAVVARWPVAVGVETTRHVQGTGCD